ncbi:hypothetical protein EYC84_007069 [Monilinia fructicola]|uniref:Uncharacterized protein n=1 Tax=Monilinia fructicola TaxID=38448 RepID=A0A5M9K968_MONFR|nr:hypothetical protein EYC84_007069 [Monilinia fructicola]
MPSTENAEKKMDENTGTRTSNSSNIEKGDVVPRNENAATRHEDQTIAILELVKAQDVHHPMHWSALKRWVSSLFIACSKPLLPSPVRRMSLLLVRVCSSWERPSVLHSWVHYLILVGAKWIYVISIAMYAIVNFGTAYAINLPMLIIFMFPRGHSWLYCSIKCSWYNCGSFWGYRWCGTSHGPFRHECKHWSIYRIPVGEWIADNENMETLPRLVIAKAAAKSQTVDEQETAILKSRLNVLQEMKFVTTMTFKIMFTEPVVLFLGLYNGFAYGILFLYLDGVFDVFVVNNGLSYIGADLTYLNFVVGVVVMFLFIPVQTWLYARDRKKHGINRPEARFITSLVTVWLFPITLLWFAFTSDGSVSYWSPVVAGGVLGFADPLLWLSMLNYITGMCPLHPLLTPRLSILDSYPNVAGAAIAAFLIPSFALAAGLAHLGVLMFDNMSTKWAMGTIGFISIGLCAFDLFHLLLWRKDEIPQVLHSTAQHSTTRNVPNVPNTPSPQPLTTTIKTLA